MVGNHSLSPERFRDRGGGGAPPTFGRIIVMQGYRINVKIRIQGAPCPGVLPPIHRL